MTVAHRLVAGFITAGAAASVAIALVLPPDPLPAGSGVRWTEVYLGRRDASGADAYAYDVLVIGGRTRRYDGTPQQLPANTGFELLGWAYDSELRRPSTGIAFRIDGGVWQSAEYHLPRPDVAAAFNDPAVAASGFHVRIPPGSLRPGWHTLDLASVEGSRRALLSRTITLKVTAR